MEESSTIDLTQLLSNSYERRIAYLKKLLDRLDFIDGSQLSQICQSLFTTLNKYYDFQSRKVVIDIWKEIVNKFQDVAINKLPKVLEGKANTLLKVCKDKPDSFTSIPLGRYVLLTWIVEIYKQFQILKLENKEASNTLIKVISNLTDSLLNPEEVGRGLVKAARREIKTLKTLGDENTCSVLDLLTKQLVEYKDFGFVGILLNLSLDSSKYEKILVESYVSKVIASKTVVPNYVTENLSSYFSKFITLEKYDKFFKSTVERSVLRSPELVLQTLSPLFLSFEFDCSPILVKLTDSILSGYQSSNLKVKSDSLTLFETLCKKSSVSSDLTQVINKLSKAMSAKITSWEHRVLLFKSLGALRLSGDNVVVSNDCVKSAIAIIPKEVQEQALQVLMDSFIEHFKVIIGEPSAYKDTLQASVTLIEKGLKLDKPTLRKFYVRAVATVSIDSTKLYPELLKVSLPHLAAILSKTQTAPASAVPFESYAALATLETANHNNKDILVKAKYANFGINTGKAVKEQSILINEKIYNKLSGVEDFRWYWNAYATIKDSVPRLTQSELDSFSYSLVQVASSINHSESLEQLTNTLYSIVAHSLETFGPSLIQSLKTWLEVNTIPTKFQCTVLRNILLTLFSTDNKKVSEKLATNVLILANHKRLVPTDGSFLWVTLCSKANLQIDELIQKQKETLFQTIDTTLQSEISLEWREAVFSAIKLLSFVDPTTAGVQFMKFALNYLQQVDTSFITPTNLMIWKTPKGTLVNDSKNNQQKVAEHKNVKDFAFKQWEKEVRESVAKQKGGKVKLSKEEQEAHNKLIAKEDAIRDDVQSISLKLHNAFLLTSNLISGFQLALVLHDLPPPSQTLLSKLVTELFAKLQSQFAIELLHNTGTQHWLQLSAVANPELNDLPNLIGVATLRACKLPVPSQWEHESVVELLSRVLFRLQVSTSRTPLSPTALAYLMPLLTKILQSGGIGFEKKANNRVQDQGHDDDQPSMEMEQVSLALDVLGNHCTQGFVEATPRKTMLTTLIYVIESHAKLHGKANQYLVDLCKSAAPVIDHKNETAILIDGLLSESSLVRKACLQGLECIDLQNTQFWTNLWIERFDMEDVDLGQNKTEAALADGIWEDNGFEVPADFEDTLLGLLIHEVKHVRTTAASSFHDAVATHLQVLPSVLTKLYELYHELNKPILPEYDSYGILIKESLMKTDPFMKRYSLSQALLQLTPLLNAELIQPFLQFMIDQQALADKESVVRQGMLQACLGLVNHHGAKLFQHIMPKLQATLDLPDNKTEVQDWIRESCVILYGTIARNLTNNKVQVTTAITKLLEALDTPSESVQVAAAECLPSLVQHTPEMVPKLFADLFDKCLHGDNYAKRRGAAYGLAATIKGHGVHLIREHNLLEKLQQEAKSRRPESKQGAMFMFDTLCELLGRLFEPYVEQIVPLLLVCFSDNSDAVRKATLSASRTLMSKLSGYGISKILPSLLEALEDYQWRTKCGAIELLGSMVYCAPRQLSVSLPTLVPRLIEVLNDSHHQVKGGANHALNSFTDVISNPEIRQLMPQIMDALSDPNRKTNQALKALLDTPFVHYLDSPSLALVIPILQRGLRERSTDVKRKAAQIVGNMASLTDPNDLVPYLGNLLPGLKEILIDPVPEARGTSAKSLGALVSQLGELHFPDLIDGLLDILKTDTSNVDRSGAAQGLSEILAGLDISRLEGLLPEILSNTYSLKPYVRESFVTMLIYLPATFGTKFQPYLVQVLKPVLDGLADESDYVREASLRAGQIIITNYSDQAVEMLLPELLRGLLETNWRIRQSSAQLLGDLLFNLMGISQKLDLDETGNELDEDEGMIDESGRKTLLEVLGQTKRDQVLTSLYLLRSDLSSKVRQVASAIWKLVVVNTPRTLKEILPSVMELVLDFITETNPDRQNMAATALADIVRKLGEKGLKVIIPILDLKLQSTEFEVRKSACTVLSEMINVLGKSDSGDFLSVTTVAVLKALSDESSEVRETAAKTFDTLHHHIGPTALETILPPLLNDLKQGGSNNALEALRGLVSVRANAVLPTIISSLAQVPIAKPDAAALNALLEVGGTTINHKLNSVLIPLMQSCDQPDNQENNEAALETLQTLLTQVDSIGFEILMETLSEWINSTSTAQKIRACQTMVTFFQVVESDEIDAQPYAVEWIRVLVPLYNDPDTDLRTHATYALTGLIKSMDKSDLDQLVSPIRQSLRNTCKPLAADQELPGFTVPKSITPFVAIYLQGLMFSSSDIRERSAQALQEVILRSSLSVLKPFTTQITGPLIRIVGERFPASVKVAILDTMLTLLNKAGTLLKPFLPQLQRTFIKGLGDSNSDVRSKANLALEVLIPFLLRLDTLVTELLSGIKANAETPDIQKVYLDTLTKVVANYNTKLTQASKDTLHSSLSEIGADLKGAMKLLVDKLIKSL